MDIGLEGAIRPLGCPTVFAVCLIPSPKAPEILHRSLQDWVYAHKQWFNRISQTIVLFIVYTAFCDSVENNIWTHYGVGLTLKILSLVIALFGGMSCLIYAVCRIAELDRPDAITAYFCSVKKTLAMGVPLAVLIFGERTDLSLILLPTMFYHPFQLFINGVLANRWANQQVHPT